MVRQSVVPVRNKHLLGLESSKHLSHALLRLLSVLTEPVVLEVEERVAGRIKPNPLCGLDRFRVAHPDQRRRIDEFCV